MSRHNNDIECIERPEEGFRLRIVRDDDGESANPRDDRWNEGWLGFIYHFHRNYEFGTGGVNSESAGRDRDFSKECEQCDGTGRFVCEECLKGQSFYGACYRECKLCDGYGNITISVPEWLTLNRDALPDSIMALGLYDHSGLHLYVGGGAHDFDPGGWDSGTVGFIYTTRERCEVLGVDINKENLQKHLTQEVESYDQWLRGNVAGYIVERFIGEPDDPDDEDEMEALRDDDDNWDEVDSCWGFLGSDYCKEEGERAMEACIEHEKVRVEQLKVEEQRIERMMAL